MPQRHEAEALAGLLAASTDAVEWRFTFEHDEATPAVWEGLEKHGRVRLLGPGPWERMWWQWFRVLRDFRPHVVHTTTRQGREWARWAG